MVYLNKIIKFIARHQTLSKALVLIVLLACLLTLYGPKKFEYLCPIQEIQSCTVDEEFRAKHREIILTKEQENELIALLSKQYFRRVVFQNSPSWPPRHELLIMFWCEEGDSNGKLRTCFLGIDSLGHVYGYGIKSHKQYVGVFWPWNKTDLYNDIVQIIKDESLY